jgi:hypothetical protein
MAARERSDGFLVLVPPSERSGRRLRMGTFTNHNKLVIWQTHVLGNARSNVRSGDFADADPETRNSAMPEPL